MTADAIATACVASLGAVAGPVVVVAPRAGAVAAALRREVAAASDADIGVGAVVVFVGWSAPSAERRNMLAAVCRRLCPEAPIVVCDHNQPRRRVARFLAAIALLARGVSPARARYPVARELAAMGLRVETLRLWDRERLQVVRARVAAAS